MNIHLYVLCGACVREVGPEIPICQSKEVELDRVKERQKERKSEGERDRERQTGRKRDTAGHHSHWHKSNASNVLTIEFKCKFHAKWQAE